MTKKIQDGLIEVEKRCCPRIICGLLSGRRESETLIVEEFYPIPTRYGPKIHFKPDWTAYRDVKNRIYEAKKDVVGEFHTHSDGTEELNINDRKILKVG